MLLVIFFENWYGWLLGCHYEERRIKKIRHVTHRFQTVPVRQHVTHTIHTTISTDKENEACHPPFPNTVPVRQHVTHTIYTTTSTHAQLSPQIK